MPFWEKMKNVLVGEAPGKSTAKAPMEEPAPIPPEMGEKPRDEGSRSSGGCYRKVRIEHGPGGWGGPLVVDPKPGCDLVYSVTGGGIHPLARKISELTGGRVFDGFSSKANFEEIAVAIIDCGGTARIGVYPMKNVLTVDIYPTSPSGPLIKFITEKNFVSGVRIEDVRQIDA